MLQVVVGAVLQADPEAARRATDEPDPAPELTALQLVAEHGDVVELRTAPLEDCVESFLEPYELTVFVRRDQLFLRARETIELTYPDGSAVVVQRGAPVRPGAPLGWLDEDLAHTPVVPTSDTTTLATPPTPALDGSLVPDGELVGCDGERDTPSVLILDEESLQTGISACGIGTRAPPRIDGRAAPFFGDRIAKTRETADGRYLADIVTRCGHIRLVVPREGLAPKPGYGYGRSGYPAADAWVPAAGPVTWPDGAPAGRYNGMERYPVQDVTDLGNRYCVTVTKVATQVCHPKETSERVQPVLESE